MTRRHQPQRVHLELIGNGTNESFVGVHEVPGRLSRLLRYPSESPQAFTQRALHNVTGDGALWAKLMYASDYHPPVKVLPQPCAVRVIRTSKSL